MFRLTILFLCGVVFTLPVHAETAKKEAPTPPQLKGSGLPVPRFVTLKGKETFVRAGTGAIYPVEWVFKRKGMPVEITAEFDTWRRVRDWEGAEGWVHQSLISGQRYVVITEKIRPLRRKPA